MKKGYVLSNRYRIISKIGEGGMVNVYLSYDMKDNRLVTIKIIRLDFQGSEKAKRHFKYEKLAINNLKSDHIVQVYDLNESGDIQYLVTEYVDGQDLKSYIRENYPISISRVISIMSQVIDAMNEAHKNGIIHRDLKPQNVLIDQNGDVKVTDFGIALISSQVPLTQTNAIVGSIHYISPEQALGKKVTIKSDIYSLGIILYELLTGKVPFDGDSPLNIAMKHTSLDLPSIIEQNDKVTQALENVVIKATAKRPEDRYDTVRQMKQDLLTSMDDDKKDVVKLHFANYEMDENDDGKTKVLKINDLKKITQTPTKKPALKNDRHKVFKLLSLIVVLLAFLGIIFLFLNLTLFSRVYVPNVSGLTVNQAKKKLKKSHLIVTRTKYHYDSSVSVNRVIYTKPKVGTKMINHSGIVLYVSKGYQNVKLSNYVGDSIDTAENKLKSLGFTVVKSYSYTTDFKPNIVLKQSIKPKTNIKNQNRVITLDVSANYQLQKMKNLVGMSVSDVKKYGAENHLNVKYHFENTRNQPAGKIYQQSPSFDADVKREQDIDVWVSKGVGNGNNLKHSVNLEVNLVYKKTDNYRGNKITIYSNVDGKSEILYRNFYIRQNTKVNIPYSLENNQKPNYRVYRDGKLILE
ncbi:Stk1 family PASTA domain-containing Ser/Thr kinase [Apilactobacillus bombintestini]|uniref:non-specific serine/threonine protein kinase n=1 Tax=Apilactobacillus bombintestini TaxID=2419772 RepID=A0A387ARM6_9LACO|nr:Stk1 family PASTA domain-containing Ser/Thr kinase [Apilactobacillus bombintestini]AYF92613.1 Stk1 family PASTA domain-containing Ser/Thr kinase [Apilactobacillus bombintestini]